jgi:hypothetical protein
LLSAALIAPLVLLSISCGPSKQWVRTSPSFEQRMPQIQRIGIVADVCLFHEVGKKTAYVSVSESRSAQTYMIKAAKESLEQKGYEVTCQLAPVVGGYKNPGVAMRTAATPSAELSDRTPPLDTPQGSVSEDEPFRKAMLLVLHRAMLGIEQQKKPPTDVFREGAGVSEGLRVVCERTNNDVILVLVGEGSIVPFGRSMGQAMTTGILTGLLTAGFVVVSVYDVSHLDSYIGLLDAKTGEILWSNSMRIKSGDPTRGNYYDGWSRMLLYHLPKCAVKKQS